MLEVFTICRLAEEEVTQVNEAKIQCCKKRTISVQQPDTSPWGSPSPQEVERLQGQCADASQLIDLYLSQFSLRSSVVSIGHGARHRLDMAPDR